ncbi:MAG: ATP-binding protein [Bacillota bacterium]|nr:ATP-binding protein [Bacillota bacterium]
MTWEKLSVADLRASCDFHEIAFETTAEVPPLEGMIGQERAVQATEFGLRIKRPGYNIFMTGLTGTGKSSYAQSIIKKISSGEPVPDDWVYVYNFEHPGEPIALNLPAGTGYDFCNRVEELLEDLKQTIPKAFDGEDYERQKSVYVKEFQEKRSSLLEELNKTAQDMGFALKRTSSGFVTIPVHEGEQISEEDYAKLDQSQKDDFEKKSTEVQLKAMEIMRRVQKEEKELKEQLKELDQRIGLVAIGHLFNELMEDYEHNQAVTKYLKAYQEDVLSNLSDFRGEDDEQQNPMFWLRRQTQDQADMRYTVNLLVDHRDTEGAPMVYETNPSYYNLLGRVEYENRFGMVVTDFSMIKPGALHKANGGYLILQARDVLTAMQSWEVLKRVIRTREIRIENISEHFGLVAMATLRPQPIPLNIKIVMIGTPYLYQILYHYDEDFRKLFKIKADFDVEMDRREDNINKMAGFISFHCNKQNLRHFNREAVAEIVDHSTRLAENREKLSTRFNEIVDILFEADAWADIDGVDIVGNAQVEKALSEMIYRSNKYEQKIVESIKDGIILIDTEGSKVGQVNALSVLDQGDYRFGRPSRITASTYLGRKGIVNIERESDLSGNIHDKGILIMSGCIGQRYGSIVPMNLTANLCFEQSYGGVDGDSASAAELFCLLSSLADVPLRQDLAITGSINQKGEIQPIGGVNYKIEGFYLACKAVGLTGTQGVIIPEKNRRSLMLQKEVVEAVEKGQFHIYTMKTIDEGLELLSGLKTGELQEDNTYPEDSFNGKVVKKLKDFNEAIKAKKDDKNNDLIAPKDENGKEE